MDNELLEANDRLSKTKKELLKNLTNSGINTEQKFELLQKIISDFIDADALRLRRMESESDVIENHRMRIDNLKELVMMHDKILYPET